MAVTTVADLTSRQISYAPNIDRTPRPTPQQGETTPEILAPDINQGSTTPIVPDPTIEQGSMTPVASNPNISQGDTTISPYEFTPIQSNYGVIEGGNPIEGANFMATVTNTPLDPITKQGSSTPLIPNPNIQQGGLAPTYVNPNIEQGETTPTIPNPNISQGGSDPIIPDPTIEQGSMTPVIPNPIINQGSMTPVIPNPDIQQGSSDPIIPNPNIIQGSSNPVVPNPNIQQGSSDPIVPDPIIEQGSSDPTIPNPNIVQGSTNPNIPNPNIVQGSSDPIIPNPDIQQGSSTPVIPTPNIVQGSSDPVIPNPNIQQGSMTPVIPNPNIQQGSSIPVIPNPNIQQGSMTPIIPNPNIQQGSMTPVVPNPNIQQGSMTPVVPNPNIQQGSSTPVIPNPNIQQGSSTPVIPNPTINQGSMTPIIPNPAINQGSMSPIVPNPNIQQGSTTVDQTSWQDPNLGTRPSENYARNQLVLSTQSNTSVSNSLRYANNVRYPLQTTPIIGQTLSSAAGVNVPIVGGINIAQAATGILSATGNTTAAQIASGVNYLLALPLTLYSRPDGLIAIGNQVANVAFSHFMTRRGRTFNESWPALGRTINEENLPKHGLYDVLNNARQYQLGGPDGDDNISVTEPGRGLLQRAGEWWQKNDPIYIDKIPINIGPTAYKNNAPDLFKNPFGYGLHPSRTDYLAQQVFSRYTVERKALTDENIESTIEYFNTPELSIPYVKDPAGVLVGPVAPNVGVTTGNATEYRKLSEDAVLDYEGISKLSEDLLPGVPKVIVNNLYKNGTGILNNPDSQIVITPYEAGELFNDNGGPLDESSYGTEPRPWQDGNITDIKKLPKKPEGSKGAYSVLNYDQIKSRAKDSFEGKELDPIVFSTGQPFSTPDSKQVSRTYDWRNPTRLKGVDPQTDNTFVDEMNSQVTFNDTKDYVRVLFRDKRDNTSVQFRSYIENFSDRFNSNWSDVTYVGRPNPLKIFNNVTRDVSLDLMVPVLSRGELKTVYGKLARLAKHTMPNGLGVMRAPVMELTLGDWFENETCHLTSLTYTIETDYSWEINIEQSDDVGELPQIVKVSLGIFIIGNNAMETGNYSIFGETVSKNWGIYR